MLDDLTMIAQVSRYGRALLVCTVQGTTLCFGHWMTDLGLSTMGPGHELGDLQRALALLRRSVSAYIFEKPRIGPPPRGPVRMIGAVERATGHSYRGCKSCDRAAMQRLSHVSKGRARDEVAAPPEKREVDWGEGWRSKPLRYR